MIKLLSITSDSEAGGSSQSLFQLLKGLKRKGVLIKVILPRTGYLSKMLDSVNIEYEYINNIRLSIWPPSKTILDLVKWLPVFIYWRTNNWIALYKINKIVHKFKPNIIHSNVSAITIGYNIAKKNNILHIWHIREFIDKDFGLKFYPSFHRRLKILKDTPSISITKEIQNCYNLYDKGVTIYNGVKTNIDFIYNPNKEDYFLFVGQVDDYKGIPDLINAYIIYKKNNGRLKLKIVGAYKLEYYNQLRLELEMSKLKDEVEFTGHVDNVNVYMQKAKALIVPSKYEAFGRITAEAMFNGCLIIGRNTGGTKEQMDMLKDYCGHDVAIRFENVLDLTNAMTHVESLDKDVMESYILSSQDFAQKNFTSEINVDNTYNFIQKIMNN